MANFLITTPNSLTQGTDTTDLFVINTALGITVNGGGGADTLTANATNGSNAVFAAGAGNDTIFLTAAGAGAVFASVQVLAGNGSDLIAADGIFSNSVLKGGGGNDTINLSAGSLTNSTIFGNLGSDLISANGTRFTRAFIAAGGDNDTINLKAVNIGGSTIRGGGGADLLTLSAAAVSGSRIEGDDPNDSQFFGNDTIRIAGLNFDRNTVLGGGGADVFQVSATLGSGNRFEGGTGADSIFLSSTTVLGNTFIGMGSGNDTITVNVLTNNFGTIQGGGGLDNISVSGGAVTGGGLIFGGDGADQIGLGIIRAGAWGTTGAAVGLLASGVTVAYSNFSESNLAGFDIVSARASQPNTGGNAFMLNQSVVTFSATTRGVYGAANNQITVGTGSRVTLFENNATVSLTARASAIDAAVGVGGTVVFNAGGQNFLFVQGGAAGGGTGDDLIVQLNVAGFNPVNASGKLHVGGLYAVDANNVKIAFTNNAGF